MARFTAGRLLLLAGGMRLGMIAFGHWQDTHMEVGMQRCAVTHFLLFLLVSAP